MADLTAKEHVELIRSAEIQLIQRIGQIATIALAAIISDRPQGQAFVLEQLRQHRLSWHMDNERFFTAIEFALEQLGIQEPERDPLLEFIEDNDAGPSDAVRLAKLRAKQAQEAALPDENPGAQSTPDSTSGQPT